MNPVTGPFVKEVGKPVDGLTSEYSYAKGYKQTLPYDLALPYSRLVSKISSFTKAGSVSIDTLIGDAYNSSTFDNAYLNFRAYSARFVTTNTSEQLTIARAKNSAYEKMVSELGERVELLVTVAERREAYRMVEKRLVDLYRFAKAIRHPTPRLMRQFFTGSALPRPFRVTLKDKLRNWRAATRDIGQLWLELHFGWEPIVRDIDTSLQRMSEPLPEGEIEVQSPSLPLGGTYGLIRSSPWSWASSTVYGRVKVYANATVQVDNPTAAYKTILGLNNPALVAYNLIPWSWMFDWVNYLGTYISSFSDLDGYTVIRASHAVKVSAVGTFFYEYPRNAARRRNSWSGVSFERIVGLPRVTLTWRPLKQRYSVIRGVTLASVIAGLLDPRIPKTQHR